MKNIMIAAYAGWVSGLFVMEPRPPAWLAVFGVGSLVFVLLEFKDRS